MVGVFIPQRGVIHRRVINPTHKVRSLGINHPRCNDREGTSIVGEVREPPLLVVCAHELGGGGAAGGTDALALEDFSNRHEQYFDIQPEGVVIDIPYVEGELVLPGEGVAPVHLCPAGDAGEDFVAARLLGGVAVEVLDQQRARTDQAHLAFEDVEELGQFIQAGGAQEAPEAGEALLVGEQVTLGITQVAHGAEFVEFEDPTVQPGALLAENHRPAEEKPDEQEQKNQNRRNDDQCNRTDKYIQNPFGYQIMRFLH